MIEKFKEDIDRGGKFVALLTDHFKSIWLHKPSNSYLQTWQLESFSHNALKLKTVSARDLIYYMMCHRGQF